MAGRLTVNGVVLVSTAAISLASFCFRLGDGLQSRRPGVSFRIYSANLLTPPLPQVAVVEKLKGLFIKFLSLLLF